MKSESNQIRQSTPRGAIWEKGKKSPEKMSITHNLSISNMKPLAWNPYAMLHILLELDKYQSDNAWYTWILELIVITPLHLGFAAHRLGTAVLDWFYVSLKCRATERQLLQEGTSWDK